MIGHEVLHDEKITYLRASSSSCLVKYCTHNGTSKYTYTVACAECTVSERML